MFLLLDDEILFMLVKFLLQEVNEIFIASVISLWHCKFRYFASNIWCTLFSLIP